MVGEQGGKAALPAKRLEGRQLDKARLCRADTRC
jgi:hypothetical protein